VRWAKGKARPGRYRVYVQNYAFHEQAHKPTPYKVELEVNGEVRHFEGAISPGGQTGDASNVTIAELDYEPAPAKPAAGAAEAPDPYKNYGDDVILAQWATVIPREHIIRIADPAAIIDVLLGALAIADGKVDLATYARDMAEAGTAPARIAEVETALANLPGARRVATAAVEGDLPPPAEPGGGKKRSVRL